MIENEYSGRISSVYIVIVIGVYSSSQQFTVVHNNHLEPVCGIFIFFTLLHFFLENLFDLNLGILVYTI